MILQLVGAFFALFGALFLLLASIGINRMPDTYTRMLSASKASTLGTLFFLIGIALRNPGWGLKLFFLFITVLLTAPLSAHVISRTAYFLGIPLTSKTVKDDLSKKT
ncbi:MAG: monovalent cation/H(+) antiporter subunit G [Candidatus Cloacimonadaceae bacterium]|nr:monovalent cation/H(+) antiporter subunit G [Candidatus Cloacimonadaceae bacterium]